MPNDLTGKIAISETQVLDEICTEPFLNFFIANFGAPNQPLLQRVFSELHFSLNDGLNFPFQDTIQTVSVRHGLHTVQILISCNS